ncbi:enamelin isoform X2 [Brachyhypopomus gauderio]|uniref:enamelin isoform X2 n=2 Tax=Brachyhypopomus gauderio TaxID=698409 RepID=UPI0040416156
MLCFSKTSSDLLDKRGTMMQTVVILMCVLGYSLTAPAPEQGSNEQRAAHAHTALQLMELHWMKNHLQQQGLINNNKPVLPPRGRGSVMEGQPQFGGSNPPDSNPAGPADLLNSDEVEESEGGGAPASEPADDPIINAPLNAPALPFQ